LLIPEDPLYNYSMGRKPRAPEYTSAELGDMWRCTKCKAVLPTGAFNKDRNTGSGLSSWCKACTSAHHSQRYQATKDLIQEQATYIADLEERLRQTQPTLPT
jgi:Zn-finger protein